MNIPILVIGVGNAYRRDDGAGAAVARGVREARIADVTVVEASGEGASLIEAWSVAGEVIIVDAVRSGTPAGNVVRFELPGDSVPAGYFHYSTHAFSVAEAIGLGRELDLLPERLTVIGIEGADFGNGEGLSAPVAAAVRRVTEELVAELRSARKEPIHA